MSQNSAIDLVLFDRLEKMEVGITDADYAVAHTGTLLFRHSPERYAQTNLFPWTHVAVVRLSQMVRRIDDLAEIMAAEHRDRPWHPNTIFQTGPSRSGDIDIKVGQGAAGPGETYVILIEDGQRA